MAGLNLLFKNHGPPNLQKWLRTMVIWPGKNGCWWPPNRGSNLVTARTVIVPTEWQAQISSQIKIHGVFFRSEDPYIFNLGNSWFPKDGDYIAIQHETKKWGQQNVGWQKWETLQERFQLTHGHRHSHVTSVSKLNVTCLRRRFPNIEWAMKKTFVVTGTCWGWHFLTGYVGIIISPDKDSY